MDLNATIKHMYPDLDSEKDYSLRDDGDGQYILEWNAKGIDQPSTASLIDHWERFKDEITDMFKPGPSEVEILEQTQADLIMTLMMNGVI